MPLSFPWKKISELTPLLPRFFLLSSGTGLLILSLLNLAQRWIAWDADMWLTILSAFSDYTHIGGLLGGLLLLCLTTGRLRRVVLLCLLPIALWCSNEAWHRFGPHSHPVTVAPETPVLRVLSWNAYYINSRKKELLDRVSDLNADLVVLQEIHASWEEDLHEHPQLKRYPYRYHDPHFYSARCLLSRYPITYLGNMLPGSYTQPYFRLHWAEQNIVVTAVHTVNAISQQYTKTQVEQIRRLADIAAAERGPLLMIGDFNSTPHNRNYRVMADVLRCSWTDAGRGLSYTFVPEYWPGVFLHLDYVFHSEHWRTLSYEVLPDQAGSDHRGVVVQLALTGVDS